MVLLFYVNIIYIWIRDDFGIGGDDCFGVLNEYNVVYMLQEGFIYGDQVVGYLFEKGYWCGVGAYKDLLYYFCFFIQLVVEDF